MAERYSYSPLSSTRSIRILSLLPDADHNGTLHCSLEEISIDTTGDARQRYTALSYVWGAKDGTRPLLCDGKTILITPNCESVLRHLRHVQEPVSLWVDAICINQADLKERSQQVQIMGHIYSNAIRVVIWLGEGSEESKEAMLVLATMSKYGFLDGTDLLEADAVLPGDSDFNEVEEYVKKHTNVLQSIRELLDRPWFQRMWVVQELVLAKTALMLCGSESLDWDNFSRALAVLIHLEPYQDSKFDWGEGLKRVVKMYAHRRMKIDQRSISVLIHDYRDNLASDPKDKAYSLFGLIQDIDIDVDYTVPTEEVYIQIAVFIVTQQNSLDLLHSVQGTKGLPDLDLPTWVPDWRMPWEAEPTSRDLFRRFATTKAPLSVIDLFGRLATESQLADIGNARVRFSTDSRTLNVIGVKWTVIDLVTDLSANTVHTLTKSDIFWDKLAIKNHEKRQERRELGRGLARSLRDVILDHGRDIQEGERGSITYGRVLVFLRNGVRGLATRGVEQGDVVCFLHDQPVPFVLRVKQDHYSLVGQYVL
jgi:hypothetical protein